MSYACHTHVIHMSYVHMTYTCPTHVQHMSYTCRTHARHMSNTCHTHVIGMSDTCQTHVINMSCTCHRHAIHMSYTSYLVMFGHARSWMHMGHVVADMHSSMPGWTREFYYYRVNFVDDRGKRTCVVPGLPRPAPSLRKSL